VQADVLDQRSHLRLGSAQIDRTAVGTQAAGQHREVEHQRGVCERQLAEVDDDIGLGTDRARQGLSPESLGSSSLVPAASEGRWLVIEVDDPANLSKPADG
jgi:hypothetical protein